MFVSVQAILITLFMCTITSLTERYPRHQDWICEN